MEILLKSKGKETMVSKVGEVSIPLKQPSNPTIVGGNMVVDREDEDYHKKGWRYEVQCISHAITIKRQTITNYDGDEKQDS